MQEHIRRWMLAVAVLSLAAPIWAARSDSAEFFVSDSAVVGNTHLKAGDYTLKAEESQNTLEVMRDGKVIAHVPCHWIQLPKKPDNTEVSQNGNQVVQIQFAGKTEAIQVQ